MSPQMKTLVIRPDDVSLRPLDSSSPVALAEVSVCYDRDVLVDGGWVPRFPKVLDGSDDGALRVSVLANDDPAITEGSGFKICVRARLAPVQGLHAQPSSPYREVVITSSMAAEVSLANLPQPVSAPRWWQPGDVAGTEWTPASGVYLRYDSKSRSWVSVADLPADEQPSLWSSAYSADEVIIGGTSVVALEPGVYAVTSDGVSESSDGVVTVPA